MTPPAEGFAARFVLGPALRAQPDRRLVALVREGYEAAFEEIVRRYGKPLTRYAAAIVGGHAEDVTQDAFSKALLALRRGGDEIELRPWLFRIVRNTALNDLRDSPPSAAELAETIAAGGSPAEALERREELTDLMERLRALPESQRAAIVMRELEGLSHDEIAAALGMSGGAARQAIYRARRALRDGLGMLLPLPLLKGLLAALAAGGGAEVAAGAGAVGAGGAAGAGVALKAITATALVAGAVGAGVALHDNHRRSSGGEQAVAAGSSQSTAESSQTGAATALPIDDSNGRRAGEAGHGKDGTGDDGGSRGHGRDGGRSHGREPGDDHGGRGAEPGEDRGGTGASGEGHSGAEPEPSGDRGGHHHSGGGGPGPGGGSDGSHGGNSGSDGGGGSSGGGSGESGSGPTPSVISSDGGSESGETIAPPETDGGGSGSSSGSGSGSSGSGSGSGSGEGG